MAALALAAYDVYVERMPRPPAPMLLDYSQVVADGDTILAWRDAEVVGMITVVVEPGGVLIQNVAVAPQTQGTGLGSRLLAHAEQIARDAGRPQLRLYTNEAMVENVEFYRRRGFSEVRRAEEHGYRRVFFVKDLATSAPND
ncbi:Acetyltransferase (GNAT) family protein [Plantibacter sp. RU18]